MDHKNVFIAGCPRSGTTWIHDIFRNRPDVITNVESHIIPNLFKIVWLDLENLNLAGRIRKASRLIFDYKVLNPLQFLFGFSEKYFWKLLKYEYFRHKGTNIPQYISYDSYYKIVDEARVRDGSHVEKIGFIAKEVFEAYFTSSGGSPGKIFVDKTPSHIYHVDFILKNFPGAKIIEIVRDGRDVCVSLQKYEKDWCPDNRQAQIELWKGYIETGGKFRRNSAYAGSFLSVKYEDMLADRRREITRMFDFVGAPYTSETVEEVIEKTDFKKLKVKKGDGAHYRKGVAGDWRNSFSARDEEIVKKTAGNLLEEMGYKW